MADPEEPEIRPFTEAELKARKRRNVWLALALIGFVAMVMVTTMVRLAMNSAMPDGGF